MSTFGSCVLLLYCVDVIADNLVIKIIKGVQTDLNHVFYLFLIIQSLRTYPILFNFINTNVCIFSIVSEDFYCKPRHHRPDVRQQTTKRVTSVLAKYIATMKIMKFVLWKQTKNQIVQTTPTPI